MRHRHFDAVELAFAAAPRRGAIGFEDFRELVGGGLARGALGDFRAHARGADNGVAGGLHRADMGELGEHQAAFLVHGGREPAIARHDAVVDVDESEAVRPDVGPNYRRRAGDLHAEPGAGAAAMIGDVALARQAVVGQSRLMRRQVDAAAQSLAANPQFAGDMRKRVHGHRRRHPDSRGGHAADPADLARPHIR